MRTVESWNDYFLGLAKHVATRSKDPSTQVGAVLVDHDRSVIETGYNGFAPGIIEVPERWQRPVKYDYVIHAELNAIARAAKKGKAVDGATIYLTHFPCKECCKAIISAGIEEVICAPQKIVAGSGSSISAETIDWAVRHLQEAGVHVSYHYEVVNDAQV